MMNYAQYNELFTAAKSVIVIPELITPAIAASYLKHNVDNFRKIKPSVTATYSRDMANNMWKLSCDCIAFDEAGNLMNGQHRLNGIISSGKPQVCFVMRNCPKDLFFGDTGAKRTTNDFLRHSGIAENPIIYSNLGVGVLNVMLKILFKKHQKTTTTFEVQNLIEKLPDIDMFVTILQNVKNAASGIATAAVGAAVYSAFVCTNDERVIAFLKELVSGVGQPMVINLRDKLITKAYGTNGSATQITIIKVVQRVIKAYLDGEQLAKIYVPTDVLYTLDDVLGGTEE